MTPISLGIFASANQSAAATSFESIATVTVGAGGASSAEFTSIPSTYTHLQIRAIARGNNSSAGDWYVQLGNANSADTGTNYSSHYLYGNATNVFSGGSANQTSMYMSRLSISTMTSGIFSPCVLDILDYSNSNKFKTLRSLSGVDTNGVTYSDIEIYSGMWRNTAAINYIKIFPQSGAFVQYSSFALYGIKSA